MAVTMNRQWRLACHPVGMCKESDLEWREERIPVPGDGQVLVRNIYLSLDPTNRIWMYPPN
jgi:NADPH-dependent curcumin reductase CurA